MIARAPFIKGVHRRLHHLACANPLYNLSLGGPVPDRLAVTLSDPWPGSVETGRLLADNPPLLAAPGDGDDAAVIAYRHGFSWLRDLRTLGTAEARRLARQLIEGWIHDHPRWDALTWRPDIAGRRIANWLALYDFFGASAGADFQHFMFQSVLRQARHLSRALPAGAEGIGRLHALRGLSFAGLSFGGREPWLAQALDILQRELGTQILPDGGHISRSPENLMEALRIVTDIRTGLAAGGYPVPDHLAHTIDRMAQALRFFRYADKGFAVFNGGQEGDPALIDAVLLRAQAQGAGRILRNLPQSGYERLTLGRSVVMVDAGLPPPRPHDIHAHAAPLAFEFIYGKERVFVSCGTHPMADDWRQALRATAAHTTLDIDCRNACEIRGDGGIGRRPRTVPVLRDDSRDAVMIEAAHDGYTALNGITHRRRLYLGAGGHDLRGEDTLTCITGLTKPAMIAVRFHLHPKALVSLTQDGQAALVRLGGGAGWRFVQSGGHLALEDSLYAGTGTRARKTTQIVIHAAQHTDTAQIKWALQREGA